MSRGESYISKCLLALALAGAGSVVTGCRDSATEPESVNGQADGCIRFSVEMAAALAQGRSVAERTGAGKAMELRQTGGDSVMWLTASEYATGVSSRGSAVTAEDIEDFGVFAALKASEDTPAADLRPDYMYDVEVTRSNGWMPREEYLWPGKGWLHFNAYSPYRAEADEGEGIVALPAPGSTGELTIDYVVPAKAGDQPDLLRSLPVDGQTATCGLRFVHTLTAVRFSTGDRMQPCKVMAVEVRGVRDRATLNLETGDWTDMTGDATYMVEPGVALTATDGGQYVTADTPITGGDSTLMLLPQTLPDDATVAVTIEAGGGQTTFEASLAGQIWTAGKTMVYRISATAASGGLELEVTDGEGNRLTEVSTPYTGKTLDMEVNSFYTDATTGAKQPVEWTATYVDADGNELTAAPTWIAGFPDNGSGETEAQLVAGVIEPGFEAMSEPTANLRKAADINSTSGHTPYNLGSSTGDPTSVDNTANCYIINAPGKYSIPLVYGNGIKGGATNTGAYISAKAASSTTLTHFINHLGNEISSPYIYENAGCEPQDAVLVWEGRLCVTADVHLSDDGKSVVFDIPAGFIRQANAVVAVRDKNSAIMWSWHLWITDYKPEWAEIPNTSVAGLNYYLFTRSLGRIVGGDVTVFPETAVTLRLTQTGVPEGQTPLTADVKINREGKTIDVADCYSFYQWSRKDPVVSGIEEYYTADHVEHASSALATASFSSDYKTQIEQSIRNPSIFYTSESRTPFYLNLWNINLAASSLSASNPVNVKTIYDPCPVGARVPLGNVFLQLVHCATNYDESDRMITFFGADGKTPLVSFPVLGYRQRGGHVMLSSFSPFWMAEGRNGVGRCLSISGSDALMTTNAIAEGFGIHPAKE